MIAEALITRLPDYYACFFPERPMLHVESTKLHCCIIIFITNKWLSVLRNDHVACQFNVQLPVMSLGPHAVMLNS